MPFGGEKKKKRTLHFIYTSHQMLAGKELCLLKKMSSFKETG